MVGWPFINNAILVVPVDVVLALTGLATVFLRARAAACALWCGYGVWEWFCTRSEADIRVDLLLIVWLLPVLTIGLLVMGWFRSRPTTDI